MNAISESALDGREAAPPALSPARIFLRFLRFGLMAWGGPVAQIAMIRRELVDEERWISSGRFNRLLAIYQVLPGPEAHELCVHMGMLAGKRLGGLLAGLGFMLPGFLLMMVLSWIYLTIEISQSAWGGVFLGVQVGVIALVARAVHRIGSHILVDRSLWGIAAAAAIATLAGASFWLILPMAGLACILGRSARPIPGVLLLVACVGVGYMLGDGGDLRQSIGSSPAAVTVASAPWWATFLAGLKAGLLTFGGAYTAIPFLRDDAVGRGWMTDGQFLDGLALSGVLPAPLIIFSTFVGYLAGGPVGAVTMTAGIFLPAFAFTLIFYDRLEAIIANDKLREFLDGVAAAVVGLIAVTVVELVVVLIQRLPSIPPGLLIFVMSLATLYLWKSKLNLITVVIGSGSAGWLLFAFLRR